MCCCKLSTRKIQTVIYIIYKDTEIPDISFVVVVLVKCARTALVIKNLDDLKQMKVHGLSQCRMRIHILRLKTDN